MMRIFLKQKEILVKYRQSRTEKKLFDAALVLLNNPILLFLSLTLILMTQIHKNVSLSLEDMVRLVLIRFVFKQPRNW